MDPHEGCRWKMSHSAVKQTGMSLHIVCIDARALCLPSSENYLNCFLCFIQGLLRDRVWAPGVVSDIRQLFEVMQHKRLDEIVRKTGYNQNCAQHSNL